MWAFFICCGLVPGAESFRASAADQPQWGQAWSRNMLSEEKGLPGSFDPKTVKDIKWTALLGTETHSTPIVAGGRIYIGINNGAPRDPKHEGDCRVLMCFDEKTGNLLWQFVVPKREEDPYFDWPKTGMFSPVTVEGDRVYLTDNRGEVVCLDARGMANGNDGPFRDEGAHSSILIRGDQLYVNTATGVDNTHKRVRAPNAPSLVVIDKRTGNLVARDDEHIAPDIFHCTWSSPSLGEVNGRPLIFFAGGNGILYAFEAMKNPRVAPQNGLRRHDAEGAKPPHGAAEG